MSDTQGKEQNAKEAVEQKVAELQSEGNIRFPVNYDPIGALRQAWIIIQNTKNKQKIPVTQSCSKQSIMQSLFKMITMGLNPTRGHCDFIARGDQLTLQVSYFGNIMMARRDCGLINWPAQIVWKGEELQLSTNPVTGEMGIEKHIPDIQKWTGNFNDIIAAYCTLTFQNGITHFDIMVNHQIRQSWNQGDMKGNSSAHKNFPDMMSKRTVINRALSTYVHSSDDVALFNGQDQQAIEAQEQAEEKPVAEMFAENYQPPTNQSTTIEGNDGLEDNSENRKPVKEPEPEPEPDAHKEPEKEQQQSNGSGEPEF